MKSLLIFTATVAIVLIFIILKLLLKIRELNKKIKYVDNANMWYKLAVTDDLTGIYNRNAYNLQLGVKKKRMRDCSRGIILFDVDNFKIINDTKGHLEGDTVLKHVAKNLLEIFHDSRYKVFRIGGDEFSVLSEGVYEEEIVERLIALKKLFESEGDIRLSKGYSIFKDNSEEAFKCADEMLYADKLSKKMQNSSTI